MKKPFEIDNVGDHDTSFLVSAYVTFILLLPVCFVLSYFTGWWS